MKSIPGIFVWLIVLVGLVSCDELGIKINTNLKADLNIDVEEPPQKDLPAVYDFYAEETIDPLSDPDVQEYIDNIQGWTVDSISVEVISVNTPGVVFMAGTFFRVSDNTDQAEWLLDENFGVTEGARLVLDNSGGDWDTVTDILERNAVFKVSTGGQSNMANVLVTLRLSIAATVKVNPL